MGVYNNNKDGTRSTLANTIQVVDAPMEQFVSRGEFSAVTPSDVSADIKLVAENEVTKAVDTMPTASSSLVGTIVQYIGTTTNDYTHGYFYQCVSNGETPAVYSWEYVQTSDIQIATVQKAGIVKPDGETIQVDANGTISVIDRLADAATNETSELPIYQFANKYAYYPQSGKINGTDSAIYSAKRYDVRNIDEIYATFSTNERTSSFAFVLFIDDSDNIISEACRVTSATEFVREKITVPNGATYCSLTYYAIHGDGMIESYALFNPLEGVSPISRKTFDGGYANIFRKIGIIGDSISCGAIDVNGGQSAVDHWEEYAWSKFISDKTGCQLIKLAQGGLQINNWMATPFPSVATNPDNKADSYFFMIGHNDQGNITGTTADINTADLPSSSDSTTYGKFGRIIGVCKTANPDAKLFFITYPVIMSGTLLDRVNTMIREVCETVGGYLIDLAAYDKLVKQFKPTSNSAHYTPLGYYYMSVEIMTYVDYIVRHNFSDFADLEIDGVKAISDNGVPPKGTTGQVLVKSSDADYDTEWGSIGTAPIMPSATVQGAYYYKSGSGSTVTQKSDGTVDFSNNSASYGAAFFELPVNQKCINKIKISCTMLSGELTDGTVYINKPGTGLIALKSNLSVTSAEEFEVVLTPEFLAQKELTSSIYIALATWSNVSFNIGFSNTYGVEDSVLDLNMKVRARTLEEKKAIFLGDSITALTDNRSWVEKFLDITGCLKVANVAVASARLYDYEDTVYDGDPKASVQHNNTLGNQVQKIINNQYETPDLIIIAIGTNGGITADTTRISVAYYNNGSMPPLADLDRTHSEGAFRYCTETLHNLYPSATIFWCNPIQAAIDSREIGLINTYGDNLKILTQWGAVNNVETNRCGIMSANETGQHEYLVDGLHPNEAGALKMARYNSAVISALFT